MALDAPNSMKGQGAANFLTFHLNDPISASSTIPKLVESSLILGPETCAKLQSKRIEVYLMEVQQNPFAVFGQV
eukprot:14851031-Ditylum_brightwellii.AAC.1